MSHHDTQHLSWTVLMHSFDPNKYIGIPYVAGGRSDEGADCWGLLCLIYKREFDIELPGYVDMSRDTHSDAELAEYMAAHRENWERVRDPSAGDVVLLRIAGEPIHIGVVTAPGQFIHSRADNDVVVDKYNNTRWSHRIEGFYRYVPKSDFVTVSGVPHPLKMQRIDGISTPGSTLAETISIHCANIPEQLTKHGIAFVNGERVEHADWSSCVLVEGDRVEFRMLPGKSQDEAMLTSAVIMVVAWYAGGAAAAAWNGGSATGAAAAGSMAAETGISAGIVGAVAQGAVSLLGNALVNALAPASNGNGSAPPKPQYMLAGGANSSLPYSAIPVVLGTHDFTPPLGANTFMSSDGEDRFLHLLLIWGYGPLDITNMRIGQTPLTDYADVTVYTIQGDTNEFVDGHLDWDRQEVKDLLNVYGSDISQQRPEAEITETYLTRTSTSTNLNRLSLLLTFPQGLTNMDHFNDNMGDLRPQSVTVVFEYRRLGYFNSSGIWVPVSEEFKDNFASVPGLPDTVVSLVDPETGAMGGGIVVLRDRNKLVYKPTQYSSGGGIFIPLPNEPTDNETLIYKIFNGAMLSQHNTALYTGFEIFFNTVTETVVEDGVLGGTSSRIVRTRYMHINPGVVSDYNTYRDATRDPFDKIIDINLNAEPGQYEIRVKRTNAETTTEGAADKVMLLAITEYSDNTRPVNPPKPLAMTAMKIRATDQLNGTMEGLTATVSSKQLIWDGVEWRQPGADDRRNNPASLFLHVLRHPACAKPVPYASIDIAALQHWSEFCDAHGFVYENVITGQRPMREILVEIAAAGRASLAMPDGKWSVAIDEPKSAIVQHFTPSNSWGFRGVRLLPKRPHALRCRFLNRRKDYQPDEMLIYDDGYNESNATLIESIELPGVTQPVEDDGSPGAVWRLGRHHMEQIILRPEEYELYSDVESIICTRGDRIKVTHDIPMWGLGSGRIKSVVGDVSGVVLDEPMQMEAGKSYTLRWRTSGNVTNTATIAGTAGLFTTLNFTTTITTNKPAAGDQFMFGELDRESVDCLVKSVEPLVGLQARMLLCDYAPAVFDAETKPFGVWESQVTLPPPLARSAISQTPIIASLISDEGALTVVGNGFQANILAKWNTSSALNGSTVETFSRYISDVEAQYRLTDSINAVWKRVPAVSAKSGSVTIGPLVERQTFDIRLRFIGEDGRTGPWLTQTAIYVTGKTNPPPNVTGLTYALEAGGIVMKWGSVAAVDLEDYVVKRGPAWGSAVEIATPRSNELRLPVSGAGGDPYWVVARDTSGNVSIAPASLTVPIVAPGAVSPTIAISGADYVLHWSTPTAMFLIDYYEIRYGTSWGAGTVVGRTYGTVYQAPVTWGGERKFWVAAIDIAGNIGVAETASLTITSPAQPMVTAQVVDNNVLLYWTDSTTSLPIIEYQIKRGAEVVGTKKGLFTTLFETVAGTYAYAVIGIDSAGNYGTPKTLTVTVSQPPDYVLRGDYDSSFAVSGNVTAVAFSNAKLHADVGGVVMPINTTETVEQHFSRSLIGHNNRLDGWTLSNSTVTFDSTTDPNGFSTADRINRTAVGNHYLYKTLTTTSHASTTYTFSVYLKSGTMTGNVVLRIRDGAATEIATATVTPTSTWARYSVTGTFGASPAANINVFIDPTNDTGVAGDTFYAWGAQLVVGSSPIAMWATPQDQITAGYPIFIQPAVSPGYYEETIDIGSKLGACKVTVSPNYTVIAGSPTVSVTISLSEFGSSWIDYPNTTQVFGTDYRYVKVRVTVSGDDHALINLIGLNTRLDAKLKTISGSKACLSTDSGGTTIYITDTRDVAGTPEFVDVEAIQVTPAGTSPITAIYDFADSPNPTSFKILLFNSAGARVSGTASWTVRGY